MWEFKECRQTTKRETMPGNYWHQKEFVLSLRCLHSGSQFYQYSRETRRCKQPGVSSVSLNMLIITRDVSLNKLIITRETAYSGWSSIEQSVIWLQSHQSRGFTSQMVKSQFSSTLVLGDAQISYPVMLGPGLGLQKSCSERTLSEYYQLPLLKHQTPKK